MKLHDVAPPVGVGGLQSLRASLSGSSEGETIAALVFWDAPASAVPLGGASGDATAVQTSTVPGGLLALRRLNVLVLYRRAPARRDLAATLRRALAGMHTG